MAVGYNPRAITDGLVLSLDAGNPKNYNAGISTNWTDKVGGNNGTLVGGTYHNDGPFVGAGYVEFDGTGDYLSIADSADFDFGTGDFTLEFWVYIKTSGQTDVLFVKRNSNAIYAPFMFILFNGDLQARYSTTGSSWSTTTIKTNANISTNTWHHVVMVRSGSSFTGFYDGQSVAMTSSSSSLTSNTDDLVIGGDKNTNYFDGYISNVRVIKGTALYTSNFTPPTKPLTAVTNTKLLTCQGNTIADASSSAHTITANGDISLTKEPFAGAGSVEFDGTGDYLSIPDSTDLDLSSGDFTIEAWIYPDSGSTNGSFITKRSSTAYFAPFVLRNINTTSLAVLMSTSGSSWNFNQTATSALTTDAWQHVAVTRSGTAIKAFVNGTEVISSTLSGTLMTNTQPVIIGSDFAYYLDGKISNLRVIKGTALYTSNFTVPSRTLEPIENTVLLTCQGQNIKDASSSAHAITVNGDAKATIVSSAFEFDGTNDCVDVTNNANLYPETGDFTAEVWCRGETAASAYYYLLSNYGNSGSNYYGWAINTQSNGSGIRAYMQSGSGVTGVTISNTTVNLNDSNWHHVVFVRSGNAIRLYHNGEQLESDGDVTGYNVTSSESKFRIGKLRDAADPNGGYYFWNGKISGVKIYKGKGLTAAEVQQNYNATKGRYA